MTNLEDSADLLARHAEIMNRCGPDSLEAVAFREAHADNPEFVSLAETASLLKRAINRRAAEA